MNSIQEILDRVWPGWKVEERLGKGAFGQVFKISREVMDRRAERAMKVMHIPTNPSETASLAYMNMDNEQIKAYFEKTARSIANEYMIMESLKGAPNIVQVDEADLVSDDDGPGWTILIRMELLEPIRSYHKRVGYPDEKEVIRIGEDICSALEYCGMKHIIHRDIKPENVFRNEFGIYKLGDFGISRQLEHTQAMYSRKGTVSYMAPEVYYGRKYDETADIYSLGIMLYRYMNRQRMPFVPTDTEELTPEILEEASGRRVSGEKLPAPVDASPALSRVILKACDPDPRARYQSAKAFREALASCIDTVRDLEQTESFLDDEDTILLSSWEQIEGRERAPRQQSGSQSTANRNAASGTSKVSSAGKTAGQGSKNEKDNSSRGILIGIIIGVLAACIVGFALLGGRGGKTEKVDEKPVAGSSEEQPVVNEQVEAQEETAEQEQVEAQEETEQQEVVQQEQVEAQEEVAQQETEQHEETDEGVIVFDDAALEYAVRRATGIATREITREDAEDIKELNLSGDLDNEYGKIKSIKGLSAFKWLEKLDLSGNSVSDVSELSGLVHLRTLELEKNKIKDLEPLQNLTTLTKLDLNINDVTDISPIQNMKKLQILDIRGNAVSSIDTVRDLTKLKELYIAKNEIADISPISKLTNLTYLSMGYNNIDDISPLYNLTSLGAVTMNGNKIRDISVLTRLKKLHYLEIADNPIEDYSPLKSLPDNCEVIRD